MSERESPFSFVGQKANPHPSGDDRFIIEVIDQNESGVYVRYVSGLAPAWWISKEAWEWWHIGAPRD